MASSTVEDYVKQIYLLEQRDNVKLVLLGRLAEAVGVVPGTATTMVKALAEAQLVKYEPRQGVRLTVSGQKLALHVLRRHRLIELFLVNVLKFDWADVHREAELLEHAVTERVLDRIDNYLGRPSFDPHGDPIPNVNGKVARRDLLMLAEAEMAEQMTIARIDDQDEEFLRYTAKQGLVPGTEIVLEAVDLLGDAYTIKIGRAQAFSIGGSAARKIAVTRTGKKVRKGN